MSGNPISGDHYGHGVVPNEATIGVTHENRLATAEALGRSNTEDIRQLAASIKDVQATVNVGFERLHERVSQRDKTNWSALLGVSSVIITIMSLMGAPYVRELGRMDAALDRLITNDRDAMYRRGVFDRDLDRNVADMNLMRERVADIESKLQREMRDLDMIQVKAIDALRERVDEKLQILRESSLADRARLREDIDRNRSLIDALTATGSPQLGERVRAIERSVFGGK